MASQQQNIDGSSIEHSNVQQNQARRDAVSFLNSHDNQVIIDNTFLKLFPQSDRSQVDWEWGLKLLEQKQLPEIRKRLTDTLGRDRILMDISIEEQQQWVNRSPLAADRILQIDGKNCGILNPDRLLIETFGRDDIKGKLLILGAPGAGKTTALLSLAEQLVCGAISQPKTVIPVIFELSTWRDHKQSIQDWLIEQLYDLHGGNRKAKLYEQWLERQVLLPLLDGLDELGLERQKKCTEKLNEFAEHYPQMVVCCRVKEFEAVDIKLRNLRGAVCLQSLSDSQIQDYLSSLEHPELWEAIETTPYLKAMLEATTEDDPGLLRVPLFVKLIADVYDPQPISSKADLLDKYIDRQLSFDKREIDRRKELREYKWAYKTVKWEPDWKKTKSNISWLARNLQANRKVDLLVEKIQPDWIDSIFLQGSYRLIWGLMFGLFWGAGFYLISGLISGLVLGILLGVILEVYSSDNWMIIEPVESFEISLSSMARQEFLKHLRISLGDRARLIFIVSSSVIMTNLLLDFSINHKLIRASLTTFALIKDVQFSSLITLSTDSTVMVIFYGLVNGLKCELKMRSRPNQGIYNCWLIQIWTTTIVFPLIILFSRNWQVVLLSALTLGYCVGGGRPCLQHLSLRIVLWHSGLPWDFARFLNYCVERRLLLRVGGSYRFLHRELLDHFAQPNC
jgi:DNA polymerase III delta prime subunit